MEDWIINKMMISDYLYAWKDCLKNILNITKHPNHIQNVIEWVLGDYHNIGTKIQDKTP